MVAFIQKNRKILKFIHSALNIKRTKCISLVAYVFALNFVFIYANLQKPQVKINTVTNLTRSLAINLLLQPLQTNIFY